MIVDKWFVDKGPRLWQTRQGRSSSSTPAPCRVLKCLRSADARVQVVSDDARALGGYRARRAWGQDVRKAEKDKERANKVAQQVRRAVALTAELAAQSDKKVSAVVCDQTPRLCGELAGHFEAPNTGAGGSRPPGHNDAGPVLHKPPQARARPRSVFFLRWTAASLPTGGLRGSRRRSATRIS